MKWKKKKRNIGKREKKAKNIVKRNMIVASKIGKGDRSNDSTRCDEIIMKWNLAKSI